MSKKIIAFVANGTEEVELLSVVDLLRRAGLDTEIISVHEEKSVVTSHGIRLEADGCLADIRPEEVQAYFLPGGLPGAYHLRDSEALKKLVTLHAENGGDVYAICAAPSVLGTYGLLRGKRYTCYPGFSDEAFGGSHRMSDGVVEDGNIVTARGLGYALELGLTIVKRLQGEEAAVKMAKAIQYDFYQK